VTKDSEKHQSVPPPAVVCDRVLHYAVFNNSVGYSEERDTLFVGTKKLGRVPCLAICQDRSSSGVLLNRCNSDWEPLGVSAHDDVAAAKQRAEHTYPGSSAFWKQSVVTEEEAVRYLDERFDFQKCSFCGKKPYEVDKMISSGSGAWICDKCVIEFYSDVKKPPRSHR
jgi:ribosomal protein L37AE/L43A